MAPHVAHVPCRRSVAHAVALAVLVAVVLMSGGIPFWGFVAAPFPELPFSAKLSAARLGGGNSVGLKTVICYAQDTAGGVAVVEAPPADSELADEGGVDPRPWRQRQPKREVRGTLCYARRELNEEAERLRPYFQPLLEKQLSMKEITFVLNRMGAQLRPLLYRPRLGLPVFTEHKVRRLLRRAKDPELGRLNKYARPQFLPPNAPGAPYPDPLQDSYADVPPLAAWP